MMKSARLSRRSDASESVTRIPKQNPDVRLPVSNRPFQPDGKTIEKAIVSVKGGENVSVAMIRDMGHVVDRENAKVGIFITLAEATGPMKGRGPDEGGRASDKTPKQYPRAARHLL